MVVSLAVGLALALQPPPEAAPPGRIYRGPVAVESSPDTPVPEVVVPSTEPAPAPEDAAATPSSDAEHAEHAEHADPAEHADHAGHADHVAPTSPGPTTADPLTATARPPREVPRVLSTIEGLPIAERAVIGTKKVKFYPGIQVRNQVGWVSPFTLDREGSEYAEGGLSTGRIRWNPQLVIAERLQLVGTLDLANGRWAPDGSENPVIDDILQNGDPPGRQTFRIVDPRELYLQYRFSFGLVRIGQQAFTWGRGILANDGNNIDRFGDMNFGDDGPGDIYERVLFATRPFANRPGNVKHLVIGLGADLVFRDDRADLVQGDLAGQALLLVRYQPEHDPSNWIGGYVVYRNQKLADDGDVYPDDDKLEVGVVDLAGQGTKWIADEFQLSGAFESAFIFGRTNAVRDFEGTHKIAQGGLAVRGYAGDHDRWLVGFDAGYASGDPDPNDRWLNNFTFDPGHTVGLVLFEQVNGWRSARTERLATNGELTGEPLNGTEFIPTRGGVTNAIYAFPKARFSLWERLEFWGGPLVAFAPSPIVDPYTTRLNGGVPTNSVEGDGDLRFYGTEIDVGIRGRFELKNFWLQAGLQGGVLLPGRGLANRVGQTGGPIGAVWFRTEIRY